MERDIRNTPAYKEAFEFYAAARSPGTDQVTDGRELHAAPDGRSLVFTGTVFQTLEAAPANRIFRLDLESAEVQLLTGGPGSERLPKFSPDGTQIAFLSDRRRPGDFQLCVVAVASPSTLQMPGVAGWVEYLHWSADGEHVLLGTAGHGADLAGAQGGVASARVELQTPEWMPRVEGGDEGFRRRSAWLCDVRGRSVRRVSDLTINVWEAVWAGKGKLAAICTSGAGEECWYDADLRVIDIASGQARVLYAPRDQLGALSGSPSGHLIAVVEAICSDRILVAGSLQLIETQSGARFPIDTRGVDVTCTEWRSDRYLLIAGHRGFETVIGIVDPEQKTFTQTWSSEEIATGGAYVTVSGLNETGDCVLMGEGFLRAPEVAVIRDGTYRTVRSLAPREYLAPSDTIRLEPLTWTAPDGLEIGGWLLRPDIDGPRPLVMYVHGGPVWQWRPMWLGRGGAAARMLLRRGFVVFFPNPRGSAGRGQEFARKVVRDMGGADSADYMSGLDHLIEAGIADPRALGVIGASYGGFMTAWLIAHSSRFAAAVSVAPMINYVTQHLLSNISRFVSLFLGDTYTDAGGEYFKRSPLMHAHKIETPTLSVCGALDRSAPPEEAVQLHRALREHGVESVLVTYPHEGHGIRGFPAAIDYAARVVMWFEDHMGAPRSDPGPRQ
jgi:dipeptidyl aminopeptidase/acylaminoacyl peptidase